MRRSQLLVGVLVFSASLWNPVQSSAGTINFDSLSQAGNSYRAFGSSLTFDGFVFTSSYQLGGPGLIVWQADTAFHPIGGNPATSLMEYTAGHTTTIAREGGGAFALSGIDLANYGPGSFSNTTFDVTFTGTKADSTTVTQTFTVNNPTSGSLELQSFVFAGFTDLIKVQMTQGVYFGGTAFQFNNLVVDAPAAVPELASVWFLVSGVAALGVGRKRIRS